MLRKLTTAAALMLACSAAADVKLPAILSDNMVLQQEKTIPVWGWADAGEGVTVTLAGQSKSATADDKGKWMVKLDPIKSSPDAAALEMTVKGKNTLTIKNILPGEVWVCSGQSNMSFALNGAHNSSVEIPKAANSKIRLFTVPRKTSFKPETDVVGKWVECTPEEAKGFSAVAYFFGRDLHAATKLPVGLIHTSWGGTPAQAWTTIEGLKADPTLESYVKSYENTAQNIDALKAKYASETLPKYEADLKKWNEGEGKAQRAAMAAWNKEAAAAKAAGKPAPEQPKLKQAPRKPAPPDNSPGVPSVLNNAMIAPIVPIALRGAIWYQGEANAGQAALYRTLFPAMIKDWRRQWSAGDQGDFAFVWVQLANFMKKETEPTQSEQGWPGLREAQTMTLKLPNTGQAIITDIGEAGDIHPKNKDTVGQRLALAALKAAYNKSVVFSGPSYDSMTVDGDKVTLKFTSTGGGLTLGAAPAIRLDQPAGKPGDKLLGFSVAGEDKQFHWADAKIEGDTVVLTCAAVKSPKAVRYNWANNPDGNLYNKEGLPAGPFRTDDWTSNIAPTPRKK